MFVSKYPHLDIAPKAPAPKVPTTWNFDASTKYIYFLRCGTLTKIGYATHARRRARDIQKPRDTKIEVMLVFPSMYTTDLYWHTMFTDKRVHGEWFRLDTDDYQRVLDFLAEHPNYQEMYILQSEAMHARHEAMVAVAEAARLEKALGPLPETAQAQQGG